MLAVYHPRTGEIREALIFHSDESSAAQAAENRPRSSAIPQTAVGNVQLAGVWNDRDEIRSCLS